MSESEPAKKREGSSAISVAALVIVLPVAYPLSAGPVGWLIICCGMPAWTEPIWNATYAAVFWLQDHEPSGLLSAYFSLWWG